MVAHCLPALYIRYPVIVFVADVSWQLKLVGRNQFVNFSGLEIDGVRSYQLPTTRRLLSRPFNDAINSVTTSTEWTAALSELDRLCPVEI